MSDQFIPLNKSIKNRIIKHPVFTNVSNKHLNVNDVVLLYSDGKNWKLVPLNIAMMYPIIYDLYYEQNIKHNDLDLIIPISVIICPFTLYSLILFNRVELYDHVYNNNLVVNDKKHIYVPIVNKTYEIASVDAVNDMDEVKDVYVRRSEVRIMTLLNALKEFPDCLYLDVKKIKHIYLVDGLTIDYYKNDIIYYPYTINNKYHPKTLVYIIEYKSSKTNQYKFTVIVPKNASRDNIGTYDFVKNGFHKYYNKMIEKMRNKGGLIYSCLWFAVEGLYRDVKMIEL